MEIEIEKARDVAAGALRSLGYGADEAAVTADHLVDAGLRGVTFGSLPRVLALAERLEEVGSNRSALRVLRESPVSATLDGGDHAGYYVAYKATEMAVEKAKASGIAVVGAANTYYTGLFSYYMEMATREGLAAFAIGNGPAVVAPEGASEARLGTNPISFGFPSDQDPVIWDIGTCAIMHGELLLHRRLGQPLPEGVALDPQGNPTLDADEALAGAVRAWGGHKGSGLSVVVQMLGAMCGGALLPAAMQDMAYLVVVIDPRLLLGDDSYPARVAELADTIRSAAPREGSAGVRMPFERSADLRRKNLAKGTIEVPEPVWNRLTELAEAVG